MVEMIGTRNLDGLIDGKTLVQCRWRVACDFLCALPRQPFVGSCQPLSVHLNRNPTIKQNYSSIGFSTCALKQSLSSRAQRVQASIYPSRTCGALVVPIRTSRHHAARSTK